MIDSCPILLHDGSFRLIGVGGDMTTLETQMTLNTVSRTNFRTSQVQNPFRINIDNDKVWLVKYDSSTSSWVKDYNFSSEEEVKEYIFLNQKFLLTDRVNIMLTNLFVKTPYQILLMTARIGEIQQIRTKGIKEDKLNEYPLLSAYARSYDLDLETALEKVEFRIKCDTSLMSEIEYLRMKYTELISKETKLENLKSISEQFVDETFNYCKVVNI
jgi:hypothetical protein